MPVGTAEVERSFSTKNRILRSERCRLLPEHVDILMKISIKGPGIPDVRDGTKAEEAALHKSWKFCMKFGYLILRKIIKFVATKSQILRIKCTKFDFGWGSAPDPAGGAYSAPPDPLAGFKGAYF